LLARWVILATLACIELAGCATTLPSGTSPDDPFEPMNRAILDVNIGARRGCHQAGRRVSTAISYRPMFATGSVDDRQT
jgi:hypothetical protein